MQKNHSNYFCIFIKIVASKSKGIRYKHIQKFYMNHYLWRLAKFILWECWVYNLWRWWDKCNLVIS